MPMADERVLVTTYYFLENVRFAEKMRTHELLDIPTKMCIQENVFQ